LRQKQNYDDHFLDVLNEVATGEPVHKVLKEKNIHKNFLAWVYADEQRKELFSKAQAVSSEVLASQMHETAMTPPDPEEMFFVKVKLDALKFLMEKYNPDKYGPKKQVEQTINVDIAAAIEAADQRVIEGKTRLLDND